MFIELGVIVGIAIDPDEETVAIYRSTGEPIILANGDILRVAELFPGWELPVSELWPPILLRKKHNPDAFKLAIVVVSGSVRLGKGNRTRL